MKADKAVQTRQATKLEDIRPTKNVPSQTVNQAEVLAYLGVKHPSCPKGIRKRIAHIAGENRWKELSIDRLVARSAEHYVVIEVCGVLRLIECGIDAPTANGMIAAQKIAVLTLWGF